MSAGGDHRGDARSRIVEVAARLLHEQGPAAVTTRGVAEAAGLQAPAIYRHFGDKDGLLDAVAEHVMATSVAAKAARVQAAADEGVDPVADLRAGWAAQVDFGLANPAVFRLLSDPQRVLRSPAARSGRRVLAAQVHQVAQVGRLRVSEERAVGLLQAAVIGAIQTLLAAPVAERDAGLADGLCAAVLREVLTEAPERPHGPAAAVVALRALAPQLTALSGAERRLLAEWLDRVVDDLSAGLPPPC